MSAQGNGPIGAAESVAGGVMAHGLVWAIEVSVGLSYWEQSLSLPMGAHVQAFARSGELAGPVRPAAQYLESRGAYYDSSFVGEPHESAGRKPYMLNSDGVAQLAIEGPMTKKLAMSAAGTSTAHLRRMVDLAARDRDVRGAILRVDSPGGSVAGTDDLAAAVKSFAAKKPIYAFAEDFMASAAVWASAACTRIYATETTHVGSVGTILVIPDLSKMADKAGVEVHVFTNDGADYKGAGTPGTALTDKHKAYFRKMVNGIQAHFTQAVSQGRGISADEVKALGGRMFIAADAQKIGLIDGICAHEDAVAELAGAGGSGSTGKRLFSLSGLPGLQAITGVGATVKADQALRADQAALLAACEAAGIHTPAVLLTVCEDARQARDMRQLLTIQAKTAADELYGVLGGAKYFSLAAGSTLSSLQAVRDTLLTSQHAVPVQTEAETEAAVFDEARDAGRAYAKQTAPEKIVA